MANTLTALKPDYSRRRIQRRLAVVLSANYATGGEVLDLSSILNPNWHPMANLGSVPAKDEMEVVDVPGGYDAVIVAGTGTTLATAYKLQLFTTAGAELAAAAYPAALTAAASSMYLRINQSPWS